MGLLQALIDWATQSAANRWVDGLSKDYRNDPVYKRKLQELIERGRRLEDENNDKRP